MDSNNENNLTKDREVTSQTTWSNGQQLNRLLLKLTGEFYSCQCKGEKPSNSEYYRSVGYFFLRSVWIDHYHLCPVFHTNETIMVHVLLWEASQGVIFMLLYFTFDRIVFLVTLYERGHFVMLIIGSMHLISVQSWTSTSIPRLFMGTRLPKQILRLLEEEMGEEGY